MTVEMWQNRHMAESHTVAVRFDLKEREEKFVLAIGSGLIPFDAAIKAGFPESAAQMASWRLMREPKVLGAIHAEARRRLVGLAPLAIDVLEKLARGATSEKVKRDAANDILNRAGLVAPRPAADKSPSDAPLHELSVLQLRRLADRLEGELAARAKPVNAPAVAHNADSAIDLID
jgi:hypothetical protein